MGKVKISGKLELSRAAVGLQILKEPLALGLFNNFVCPYFYGVGFD